MIYNNPTVIFEKNPILCINDLSSKELASKLHQIQEKTIPSTYVHWNDVEHKFTEIRCAQTTALKVGDRYYHGNVVGGEELCSRTFILSQAPSLKKDINLFWRMIFERKELIIFDLTNGSDLSVDDHYPETVNDRIAFDDIGMVLKNVSEDLYKIKIYDYILTNTKTKEQKKVQRFNYKNWNDGDVIPLEELCFLIEKLIFLSKKEILGHCNAGVGRSGTLFAAFILKEKIGNDKKINRHNLADFLVNIVIQLRLQRCSHVISNEDQLYLLYEYGLLLLSK